MRREKEVIDQILSAAVRNENVRAVVRTNLLPGRKYIHSYEFYFVVNDTAPFEDDVFETAFGDRILLYRGDHNYPEMFPDTKAHLMVFRDGITTSSTQRKGMPSWPVTTGKRKMTMSGWGILSK